MVPLTAADVSVSASRTKADDGRPDEKRPAETLVWNHRQYVQTTNSDSMTSKAHPTTHSHPRLILYVAATDTAAAEGATAIEELQTDPDGTVQPTTAVDDVHEWALDADCIVVEGDHSEEELTTALEAAGPVPVVVFADEPFASSSVAADADGYVRRDTADAYVHLADDIERLCATTREPPAEDGPPDARTAAAVFETTAGIASCRDRDRLFERLVDGAVDVLEFEYCWLETINFGELVPRAAASAVPDEALESRSLDDPLGVAFRAREPIRIADLTTYDWLEPPFDGVRSLCSVPVGDVGVLHVVAELPDAFDGGDLALLEGLCGFAAAILERNWAERGIVNERDRLTRERSRFHERYSRLKDERDALFTLFRNVSEPTLRYDLEDGEPVVSGVNATFEAVFSVDREEIVGEQVVSCALPTGLADRATALTEAIQANEQRDLECRRVTPDGIRDFVLTVVPLDVTDSTAANAGGLLVYEDVTQQRRQERKLLAATRRLETISERIDDDARSPLNTARGYLELAEKTGDEEHFDVVETAHERLSDRLQELVDVADGERTDAEPVSLVEVATRAWLTSETGKAQLLTDGDVVLEADRNQLYTLFESVFRTTIEIEAADDDAASVTLTVGTTDDGFYVAGSRPTEADADREADPEPGRLADADGSAFGLEPIERLADAHGWDVGVAADDDGTAIAVRGVEILE
ncbi:hypothetical protein AArcMg_3573 [Natrarchaeobaculum sulfurireducens]|uniref:GAF domain-containing protein n=2 Tax=Natrarchaeobaculum sulfurireducens TaxID=2044521 RepID=A0A346PVK1_9EURY|nr:hypothetical protein AArcMg_3573 [Natrarchaeobaculum sulfurireducens]